MFGRLDGIAFFAGCHEVLDVLEHAPPDIQPLDQAAGGTYARVGHVMSHLHDGGPQGGRYEYPGLSGGSVDQEGGVVQLDLVD